MNKGMLFVDVNKFTKKRPVSAGGAEIPADPSPRPTNCVFFLPPDAGDMHSPHLELDTKHHWLMPPRAFLHTSLAYVIILTVLKPLIVKAASCQVPEERSAGK